MISGTGKWTRRHLLQSAVRAGGAAFVSSGLSRLGKASGQDSLKIAIVGGGIAGLNAAFHLKKAGITATIYEARNRLGGRIHTVIGAVGDNLVTDLGASFINSDHTDILNLVKEFNLKLFNRLEEARKLSYPTVSYYFAGRRYSEREIAEKLRPLAQQITQDARLIDQDFEQFAPKFDRLSVTTYLDQHQDKIRDRTIRTLVEMSIRTEYGVEPQEASALQLLYILPTVEGNQVEILGSSDEIFAVEGGSSQIINSLETVLSGQIQTGMRLTKIEQKEPGFRLTFGEKQKIEADYVILTLPFTVLRDVELRVNLPKNLRRFINEVGLGSNEKIFAGFKDKVWRQKRGFSLEVWTDLGFSEAWDGTAPQRNRKDGALTFFFGGKQVKAMQFDSLQHQGRKCVSQFEQIIPGAKTAATDKFLRTNWTQDPLTQGGYTNFKPGQLTEFGEFFYVESSELQERQDVRVGNLIFAGEHLSDQFPGFMNGGAQTGRLAAAIILNSIKIQ